MTWDIALPQVVEYAAPESDPLGDEGEVVVGDDQGRGLPGDVGPARPHGDADVRGPERGGVADPVARHAGDLAVGGQRPHQPQLLLGDHPGEDANALDPRAQRVIAQPFQLRTGDASRGVVQPHLPGDGQRRARVVARDHDDTDAGPPALGHRLGGPWTHRVAQAGQPEQAEREVVLSGGEPVTLAELGSGNGEDTLTTCRRHLHLAHEGGALGRREMAEVCDRLRRALRGDHVPAGVRRPPYMGQGQQSL